MKVQQQFYERKRTGSAPPSRPDGIDHHQAKLWLDGHAGNRGEEIFELLAAYGVTAAPSCVVTDGDGAVQAARRIGYPVVMKVVSPDALHKSEAGGVRLDIRTDEHVRAGFAECAANLLAYNPRAVFEGVRVMAMAEPGHDMFVGGIHDESFGPVVVFGYGDIYIELFNDTQRALCPTSHAEVTDKLKRLKSYRILEGARGKTAVDTAAYIDLIVRVACLLADFPEIRELDLNPVRILEDGSGVLALDARAKIEHNSFA